MSKQVMEQWLAVLEYERSLYLEAGSDMQDEGLSAIASLKEAIKHHGEPVAEVTVTGRLIQVTWLGSFPEKSMTLYASDHTASDEEIKQAKRKALLEAAKAFDCAERVLSRHEVSWELRRMAEEIKND